MRNAWSPRRIALLVLAVAAALVTTVIWVRQPMHPLTLKVLENARHRWERTHLLHYVMTLEINGTPYRVEVRHGRAHSITSNGQPTTTHRAEDFTLTGLFDTLERELEIRDQPGNAFGGDHKNTILRASFDPQQGFLRRYIRAVGGSGKTSTIYVTGVTSLPDPPDGEPRRTPRPQ